MAISPELSGRLMDRCLAGEESAFGELALMVQDDLYRFALAHGLNCHDAADATQETLLRAYNKRLSWQAGRHAPAWLYGFAMNVVREFRRKAGRRGLTGLDPAVLDGLEDRRPETNAGHDADAADRQKLLAEAIGRLPERQREALACRFLQGLDVSQTAAAMGCAEGTVKAAVFAAIENLRKSVKFEA
ncbi:MAG: RNA polymerase sigma factor [Planctomycetes bacterium]|nr:RNA polymerase sigma factor [Planctomycetota bacterium]